MITNDNTENTLNTESREETKPVEVHSEKAVDAAPELSEDQIRAAALAYARYLNANGLRPGEPTFNFVNPEDAGAKVADLSDLEPVEGIQKDEIPYAEPAAAEEEPEEVPAEETAEEEPEEVPAEETAEEKTEETPAGEKPQEKKEEADKTGKKEKKAKKARQKKADAGKAIRRENAKKQAEKKFLAGGRKTALSSITDFHDKAQDGADRVFSNLGRDIVRGAHSIASTYQHSRKAIGIAVLITGVVIAAILIVFDMFTVYEYAYNGKVLGYVQEQEEVTDVLDIAARSLSRNNNDAGVQFTPYQNVTFNLVDARGKSTDDSDTVVNKLIYMTDIETEAYAVCDGDNVVAVMKDEADAEVLLEQTQAELSTPDRGMRLVSSKFINELSMRPVNVLLGSIQSNAAAKELMINGGQMNTYHLVENGETVESLAQDFGVTPADIYDEDNKNAVSEIEQGDKVCIRSVVEPVSVEMVETGSIKEVLPFETIKEETDDLYKGDTVLKQEGQDGIQIFYGTITKIGGVETKRKASKPAYEQQEKIDKVILVGTAERPKTAATGTFIMPIKTYVVTSEWGGRWGRMHEGMDFGAATGTPVYASDGGKVIKANYWSGHGLCVEIDHGNGVVTRYSHLSATHVSIGDMVYQGQHIANVGNTGHSFGSHLHFEVRVNDVSQNPRNYVNP